MKDYIPCTICDCEFQDYSKGIVISDKVYAIQKDGSYIAAKEVICEYVDYGMVQFYVGYYCENDSCDGTDSISRWGYFHIETGDIVIAPIYEYAGPFGGDLACVVKKNKIGYIDYDGNIVVAIIWDEINRGKENRKYEDGRFTTESDPWAVRKGDKWGYINSDGRAITPLHFDQATLFEDSRARIKIGDKWGYININGDLLIEPVYDDISMFKCIGKDANKSYYAALVKRFGRFGFISEGGKYIINPIFEEAFEFWDIGYACVKACGKWGIIDRNGVFVVICKFDDMGEYYGKTGEHKSNAVRRWGTSINGFCQQFLGNSDIKDIYFTIETENKWGIMDYKFNIIMPNRNNHFVVFNDMKIYIKDGNVTSMRRNII